MRVWTIHLKPGQRFGFHRHVLDYFWTSVSGGRGRQHLMDGTTVEYSYQPGETRHETYGAGEYKVHDLENIGDKELVFMTVEFLAQRQQAAADPARGAQRRSGVALAWRPKPARLRPINRAGRCFRLAKRLTFLHTARKRPSDLRLRATCAAMRAAKSRDVGEAHAEFCQAKSRPWVGRRALAPAPRCSRPLAFWPEPRSRSRRCMYVSADLLMNALVGGPAARRLLCGRDGRRLDLVRHSRHRQYRASGLHHSRLLHRLYREHAFRARPDSGRHHGAAGLLCARRRRSIRSITCRSRNAARRRCAASPSSSASCSSPRSC